MNLAIPDDGTRYVVVLTVTFPTGATSVHPSRPRDLDSANIRAAAIEAEPWFNPAREQVQVMSLAEAERHGIKVNGGPS